MTSIDRNGITSVGPMAHKIPEPVARGAECGALVVAGAVYRGNAINNANRIRVPSLCLLADQRRYTTLWNTDSVRWP